MCAMLEILMRWFASQGTFVEWFTMVGEWGIVVVILYEGNVALKGYRSSKIFEAIKYVEDSDIRKYRRDVYEKLRKTRPEHKKWWDHDKELADAAGEVCSRYDVLGAMTKDEKYVREFITREWAENICDNYNALEDYIADRGTRTPRAFHLFTDLYKEAYEARKKSWEAEKPI